MLVSVFTANKVFSPLNQRRFLEHQTTNQQLEQEHLLLLAFQFIQYYQKICKGEMQFYREKILALRPVLILFQCRSNKTFSRNQIP